MESVITVCPYCGSGCKINLLVENGKVVGAEGANGVTNQGELCLKGYFGWDFLNDRKLLTPRLKRPMIRRQRGAQLEAVSWDEAISFAATRLKAIKEKHGADSIMMTGSSRGTGNESNYVAQKFARAVIGTNNIDCCARVCHAPSMAGLQATIGNGAMSNSIVEIEDTKCLLIFGYNAADSHPIVARRILKAREKGCKIIVCDPRYIETSRLADLYLPLKNGSNMALVNAFANVLISENLYVADYVASHAEGFAEYKAMVARYTPEYTAEITGLNPDLVRKAMRMYAAAPSAMILWGMGVTQWGQAVDVVKGLSSLATMTGNLGRPAVGVGPVRGQNNVQGACDMGALPNTLPGYYPVTDGAARSRFAKAWGVARLPSKPGFGITDVAHQTLAGKLKAYYILGEDPLQTDADLGLARKAFEALELIIVQDIFMTKTAMVADVILPASAWGEHEAVFSSADRGFQRSYKAIDPPADFDVKHDWEIHSLMATALGYPMHYSSTQEIWDELRELCHLYRGASYEKLSGLGYVQWPCVDDADPGTQWLYRDGHFNTANGKARLFAAEWRAPVDQVDADFPLVLSTVREVGHYSCRSMTGNCSVLKMLADEPGYVQINPADAAALGIVNQALVWVSSRRGRVMTRANITARANRGAVYMTYQWWIGACNELTAETLDPISKTPEYKYTAAKVEAIEDQRAANQQLREQYFNLRKQMRVAAGS